MNADLKLRLKSFFSLTGDELRFLKWLCSELAIEAMRELDPNAKTKITIDPIENGEDDSAYVVGDGETFHVFIDVRMPFGMVVDFLIHELAHVHSWEHADDNEDHCDEFGLSWAWIYRKYLELYDLYWG